MDGFMVTLALPTMGRHFGVALPVLKWVIVAYLLTVTVTLLPAGRLADIWGCKRIMVIGMTVLVVSAVLCALAPTNVPPEHLSVANGFLSTARNFGQAIGAALAAALLAQGLGPAGSGEALAGAVGAQLGEHHLEAVLVAQ
jgi:MFS family permease